MSENFIAKFCLTLEELPEQEKEEDTFSSTKEDIQINVTNKEEFEEYMFFIAQIRKKHILLLQRVYEQENLRIKENLRINKNINNFSEFLEHMDYLSWDMIRKNE